MRKLNATEKRDSDYHEWCRSVVEKCDWILYGSSFSLGCSVIDPNRPDTRVDIEEVVLRKLEEKINKITGLEASLVSYKYMFKKVG